MTYTFKPDPNKALESDFRKDNPSLHRFYTVMAFKHLMVLMDQIEALDNLSNVTMLCIVDDRFKEIDGLIKRDAAYVDAWELIQIVQAHKLMARHSSEFRIPEIFDPNAKAYAVTKGEWPKPAELPSTEGLLPPNVAEALKGKGKGNKLIPQNLVKPARKSVAKKTAPRKGGRPNQDLI